MEHNLAQVLPNDIWRVILAFVDNFYTIIALKRVSRWLHHEILRTKILDSLDNAKFSTKMISYFTRRKITQNIPDEPTTIKMISPKIVSFTSVKDKRNELAKLLQDNRDRLPNNGVFLSSTGIQVHPRVLRIPEDDRTLGIYWLGGHAGLLMFDLEDRSSFLRIIEEWLPFCYKQRSSLNPRMVYHLIGFVSKNKSKRAVTEHEIELLADLFGLKYHEVLSDTIMNLVQPIQLLCEDLATVQITSQATEIDGDDLEPYNDKNECSIM